MARIIVSATVNGPIVVCDEGISFWGGVDAQTGIIVDAHHPQRGRSLAGQIVMMPTSRGSCSGSGVLLDLALASLAPAALIFRESEDVLTLGAFVAASMFDCKIAILQLNGDEYSALARADLASITPTTLSAGTLTLPLVPVGANDLALTVEDITLLNGHKGAAARKSMEIICGMARAQGARRLIDVSRVHIDGCIYAAPAFLTFARKMADMGGRVTVPTTMNAISVDHANWRRQGVKESFGGPASGLANAYIEMGAQPSFTCAPYLLADKPAKGEDIAWAESNAVIYANTVLGARTVKHPDFLDLCIALTGRAPLSGVYLEENRSPAIVIEVERPTNADDSFWPMLGWLIGQAAPDRIPLVRGLESSAPSDDDLKALCGAFGTTSAAPMLHIAGVTPEAHLPAPATAGTISIRLIDFAKLWKRFNTAAGKIDLVALGSPHFSYTECKVFAALIKGRRIHKDVAAIITLGRATLEAIRTDGTATALEAAGVKIIPDLCWCSISEPVFPPNARVLMTNSGKYAHYAPGLSKRAVRFGSLAQCAQAAETGIAPADRPRWLASQDVILLEEL